MHIKSFLIKPQWTLLTAIMCVAVAMVLEHAFLQHSFSERTVREFERTLQKKQRQAERYAHSIAAFADTAQFAQLDDFFVQHEHFFTRHAVDFFVLKHGTLRYWSSNSIDFPIDSLEIVRQPLAFIDHSWFLSTLVEHDSISIVVLSNIKNEYPFENEYIHSGFSPDFDLPAAIRIGARESAHSYSVFDSQGNFVLALSHTTATIHNAAVLTITLILYALALIFALVWVHLRLIAIQNLKKRLLGIVLFVGAACIFRVIQHVVLFPAVVFGTNLFSPQLYAQSLLVPSLGDLALNCAFIIFALWHITALIPHLPTRNFRWRILFIITTSAYLLACMYLIHTLVFDSTLYLELYNLLAVSYESFVAYAIVGALFILFVRFFLYFYAEHHTLFANRKQGIAVAAVLLACSALLYFIVGTGALYALALYAFLFISCELRMGRTLIKTVSFVSIVFFALVFFNLQIQKKHQQVQRMIAENLASEKDLVAEWLLKDKTTAMLNDSVLQTMIRNHRGQEAEINQYLQKNYFSGFSHKYNLESTICGSGDEFFYDNQIHNCEEYFGQLLQQYGSRVQDSDFYFLDYQNGNISYFYSLQFTFSDGEIVKLYIELYSKRVPEELGYPSLLMREEMHSNIDQNQYSYAKYKDSLLVSSQGRFIYPLRVSGILAQTDSDRDHHQIVHINEHAVIVVTHRSPSVRSFLYWFSNIFVFYAIIFVLPYYLVRRSSQHSHRRSIADRMKYIIAVFVIFSLLITIICFVWFNRQQNRNLQNQISAKMQSILVEFTKQFKSYDYLPINQQREIEDMLIDFSNTFFTDIHIYTPQGELFASSRPEIFEYQLMGKRMNPQAYFTLVVRQLPEFATEESIGNMQFTSTYTAILNENGAILGYLNLPYFAKQYEHTQQIALLMVAIVNSYILLLLLAALAIMGISKRITAPLRNLRDTMKRVKLGASNQKIAWESNDEVGELIENYNTMIDKLSESAQLLAESERESAWREMARQIAHDIKNPLTPMKLNMQLLQRMAANKPEDFDERLQKISRSMLEQISVLSTTASSFSNFAKISAWKPERYELTEQITGIITLFEQHEGIHIQYRIAHSPLYVYADKEKIARLITNLITNAVQAIPESKAGEIRIDIRGEEQRIVLSVSDNGNGIPPEIAEHIFEFHFTTKSTGSGLGLAICKQIVENAQGRIYFESTQGAGTTFFVELPNDTSR